ncbi:MAG TPA: ATP-binding protein [Verrucomicrobiae bacterium]|jgi:signal transduction histidine kinase
MRFIFPCHFAWLIKCRLLCALVWMGLPLMAMSQGATNLNLWPIAELQANLTGPPRKMLAGRLEGIVRAVVPETGVVALQDSSGTVLLQLPQVDSTITVGKKIVVEMAPAIVSQNRFGVGLESIPTVDNSGLHSLTEATNSVFLKAGINPIRLDWFNGPAEFDLNLDYAGPEMPRIKVPGAVLSHQSDDQTPQDDQMQGLRYQAYEGVGWREQPDFSWLKPKAAGVATNFSTTYRTRDEYCGLAFSGQIQVDRPGRYTFFLKSDDGSRLYVGEPSVACKVIGPAETSLPAPENLEAALADHGSSHWVQMEGEVTFVSEQQRSLNLELLVAGNHVPVTVVEGLGLFSTNLLHAWIQVQGVCEFSNNSGDRRLIGVFVPGLAQVKIQDSAEETSGKSSDMLLLTAAQVRRLKPTEARKHIPAKIHGVVIYSSLTAVVLQDASGGVFISSGNGYWQQRPGVGESWEIAGATDAGDFSPVIVAKLATFLGYAPMPEPIRPTRDQLINGNIDAEYGELHGVITSVSSNEMDLLTADGTVGVMGNNDRPLPELPKTLTSSGSLVGSVVRIRGCFAPMVDVQTRQVVSGKTYVYPALVEMEDPAPRDPFQLPIRTTSDLMGFNARAVALQRTKLAGQIIYATAGAYFVLDRKTGFRVLTQDSSFKVGDLIEAVGFPKLDGPSPILQAAQIRKTGQAELPGPVLISPDQLLARELDVTLIEVKALLISDTIHQGERVLELQSGSQHFVARLKSVPEAFVPLLAGSRLQLTGVYASTYGDEDHVGPHIAPFELLLNRAADIVVLQRPSWWTIRRAIIVLVALSGVLSATFIWVALLRRKVEQRTVQLKQEIEQRQLVEQNHAVELERTRVARDLHDELGAGLTEVGLLGSLANTAAIDTEAKNNYLNQITQMARSLVSSLDEIVWAVNPHYDSVGSLVSYFSLYAESFLNLAGITCRLQVAKEIPQYPLDSKQRHGVFCVFRETLNNVIRHAHATEVQIVLEVTDGKLVLAVIDNGSGFEFAPEAPGKDGLASLRQRMQELGGVCQITSQPGRGTAVQISLPLNQNQYGQGSNR